MMRSTYTHLILMLFSIGLLAGCEGEHQSRSTTEFLENPIMLEAAMVRCSQDRTATRYDAECINARQAVASIEAENEAERHAEHEARSESKRQALRRTQEAAAQARRRAAESESLRKEAEYLAQFGVALPAGDQTRVEEADTGNSPVAVIPESSEPAVLSSGSGDAVQATDGGNAPGSAAIPEEDDTISDLNSIRDELQRRNEDGDD
jgi:hypothetical protein